MFEELSKKEAQQIAIIGGGILGLYLIGRIADRHFAKKLAAAVAEHNERAQAKSSKK